MDSDNGLTPWQRRLHDVIFEADTPSGRFFDIALMIVIVLSVVAVCLESIPELTETQITTLYVLEWIFTGLFTIEYVLRLVCVKRPWRYATSFFGIVDLLAILPTWLSLFIPGAQALLVVRAFRLLRVFRVFKLGRFLSEASHLRRAVYKSRAKIVVFLTTVLIVVLVMASLMHLVERETPGFESIPSSMYWAIVTITTVGYGDATPTTALGRALAAMMMIIGYSLIIVPTGILSAELVSGRERDVTTQACPHCMKHGHASDAEFCKFCGEAL